MNRVKQRLFAVLAALALARCALATPAVHLVTDFSQDLARKGSFDLTFDRLEPAGPSVAGSKGAETFGRESS